MVHLILVSLWLHRLLQPLAWYIWSFVHWQVTNKGLQLACDIVIYNQGILLVKFIGPILYYWFSSYTCCSFLVLLVLHLVVPKGTSHFNFHPSLGYIRPTGLTPPLLFLLLIRSSLVISFPYHPLTLSHLPWLQQPFFFVLPSLLWDSLLSHSFIHI